MKKFKKNLYSVFCYSKQTSIGSVNLPMVQKITAMVRRDFDW